MACVESCGIVDVNLIKPRHQFVMLAQMSHVWSCGCCRIGSLLFVIKDRVKSIRYNLIKYNLCICH